MKHWHRCSRWWKQGLACPFSSLAAHGVMSPRGGPELDDPPGTGRKVGSRRKLPLLPLPGRKEERRHRFDDTRDAIRAQLKRELRARGMLDAIPVPRTVGEPFDLPVPAGTPGRVEAARFITGLFRGVRVKAVPPRVKAAAAETAVADQFGFRLKRGLTAAAIAGGVVAAGGGIGFMFNAASRMRQLLGQQ